MVGDIPGWSGVSVSSMVLMEMRYECICHSEDRIDIM